MNYEEFSNELQRLDRKIQLSKAMLNTSYLVQDKIKVDANSDKYFKQWSECKKAKKVLIDKYPEYHI